MVRDVVLAARKEHGELLIHRLPRVRGKYREHFPLAETNWFRVGGAAEVFFKPEDVEDLEAFLRGKPEGVPVTAIGVGSNLIVRDGGIDGVVVKLGRGFAGIEAMGGEMRGQHSQPALSCLHAKGGSPERKDIYIKAGAAALDVHVAAFAQEQGVEGLEFLSGIPGTIGGALRMNAGAYGSDMAAVLVEAEAVDERGGIHTLSAGDMGFTYRHSAVPAGWIFTSAILRGKAGDPAAIAARIAEIQNARGATQPVRSRTGGSTFTNPPGQKAWQLVDAAGMRGFRLGGAQVSEQHCNFLINTGDATAKDLESLGELVRAKVKEHSDIELHWEIQRIGKEKP